MPSDQQLSRSNASPKSSPYDPFQHMIGHLAGAGRRSQIFHAIAEKSFLREQANHFDGFEQSAADVTLFVLPAALDEKDWNRFLRYALIAINLRGLAESLATEEVLRALAQADHLHLAEDVAARLSDPARRAAARAVLLTAGSYDDAGSRNLQDRIEEDLASAQPPGDAEAAAQRADALRAVARHVHVDPRQWQRWIAPLERWPRQAAAVWRTVAERWFDDGELTDPDLWNVVLPSIDGSEVLAEFLPGRLAALEVDDPGPILDRLSDLAGSDERLLWHSRVAFLGRRARKHPGDAFRRWQKWIADRRPPWSPELVEWGRELFGRLQDEQLDRLVESVDDPTVRAALQVVALEATPKDAELADAHRAAAALEAIGGIPSSSLRLHWSLRYLATPGVEATPVQVEALRAYLVAVCYEAPAEDLCRFLDLVARIRPDELPEQVDKVAWSPASRPRTMLTIVDLATEEQVLAHLFTHAERLALAVSPTEVEGFLVRGKLLRQLTCRLCLLRQDLHYLEKATNRLLPDEQEELHVTLAEVLANSGQPALAQEVWRRIRAPHRRLLTQFKVLPPTAWLDSLLDAGSRYAAMASVDAIEDERLGLTALLEVPDAPHELMQRYVRRIRGHHHQTLSVIRLARHAVAFEKVVYGRFRDWIGALELVRSALEVGSEHQLAALTPVLAELDAQRGGQAAVAGYLEAAERLITFESAPWPSRFRALEHLLGSIGPIFLPEGRLTRRRCRQAAAVLDAVARLPAGLDLPLLEGKPQTIPEAVRRQWHDLLPLVVAGVERLPPRVALMLDPSLRARFRFFGHLNPERATSRWLQSCLDACGILPSASAGDVSSHEQAEVIDLCLAGTEERVQRARELLAQKRPNPALLKALVYLLAARQPSWVPEIVCRLPPDSERTDLCMRLTAYGWLPPAAAEQLMPIIVPAESRGRPGSANSDDAWLRQLATLVGRFGVDPSGGTSEPLVRRLWASDLVQSRSIMGMAAIEALRHGERRHGEAALRLWLHAHLAPKPGARHPGGLRASAEVQEAIQQARALSPRADHPLHEPAGREDAEVTPQGAAVESNATPDTAPQIYRRWKRAAWREPRAKSRWSSQDSFLVAAFASALILFLEPALWPWDTGPLLRPWLIEPFATWIAGALVVGIAIKGWWFSRYLARRTSLEAFLPRWIRALRFLATSLPLFSLFTLAAWPKFIAMQPWRSTSRRRGEPALELPRPMSLSASPATPRRRRLDHRLDRLTGAAGYLALWSAADFLPCVWWGSWLASPMELTGDRRLMVFGICCALHLLACVGTIIYLWPRLRRPRGLKTLLPWCVPLLMLLPLPLSMLGFFTFLTADDPRQRREPLIRTAYYARSSIDRLPRWLAVKASLHERWRKMPWWQRWRRPPNLERAVVEGDVEPQRLRVYRLKTLLLILDGAAMMLVVFRLATWLPAWAPMITRAVHAVFYAAVALAALGLLSQIAGLLARLGRVRDLVMLLNRYPYGRYLMLTQLVLLLGMQVGGLLTEETTERLVTLTVAAALCAMVVGFVMILSPLKSLLEDSTPNSSMRDVLPWALFFLGISGASAAMILNETVRQVLMQLLRCCAWLTPLWAILFAARQAGWLLRPFQLRQLGSNELPRKVQASLAFLVLTAAVPLGGLAIPFWIYAYHRLWPRYRRYAGNNAGVLSANAAAPADS